MDSAEYEEKMEGQAALKRQNTGSGAPSRRCDDGPLRRRQNQLPQKKKQQQLRQYRARQPLQQEHPPLPAGPPAPHQLHELVFHRDAVTAKVPLYEVSGTTMNELMACTQRLRDHVRGLAAMASGQTAPHTVMRIYYSSSKEVQDGWLKLNKHADTQRQIDGQTLEWAPMALLLNSRNTTQMAKIAYKVPVRGGRSFVVVTYGVAMRHAHTHYIVRDISAEKPDIEAADWIIPSPLTSGFERVIVSSKEEAMRMIV